jgi:curved DNA-binding protein CbpA
MSARLGQTKDWRHKNAGSPQILQPMKFSLDEGDQAEDQECILRVHMTISPYDILGVPQKANDATIKTAFHRAAKACHPDLHTADPTAEQRLRQAVAAYEVLKNPEQRAALDRHLRALRQKRAQRIAVPAVAGLASAGVVAIVVWLSVSPSHTEIASRVPLATEWKQIAASGDPKAIWAFAVRNSGTPESQLAESRLVELIDAAVDVPTLQVLRLVAADAIAERARERLVHLEALDPPRPNSVASASPDSGGAAIKEVKPEESLAQAAEHRIIREARRVEPALQAPERKVIQEAKREEPALQPYESDKEAPGEEPAPARPGKILRATTAKLRATSPAPPPQAASASKSTPPCSGSRPCASSVSTLFGVGF